jgi:hypothetical protein
MNTSHYPDEIPSNPFTPLVSTNLTLSDSTNFTQEDPYDYLEKTEGQPVGGARKKKTSSPKKKKSPKKSKKSSSPKKKKSPKKSKRKSTADKLEKQRVKLTKEEKEVAQITEKIIKKAYSTAHKSKKILDKMRFPLKRSEYKKHYDMPPKGSKMYDLITDFYQAEIDPKRYKKKLDTILRKKSVTVYKKYKNKVPQKLLDEYISALSDSFIEGYRYDLLKLLDKFWKSYDGASAQRKQLIIIKAIKNKERLRDKFTNLKKA